MRSANEEVLLNKLLNEMDGLQLDAQVMFILTTNRPESLEAALASRPGRIDQAIEFPLPDADGRAKLVRLYCGKFRLGESAIDKAVSRTDGMAASFMKELMRRAAQFALERGDHDAITDHDIEISIEELLLLNSVLNRKLLGFSAKS
ncbi:MAG: ftsH [Gemmataceae bacterium]|nr:ftsH [Gemmataceae bacterium]